MLSGSPSAMRCPLSASLNEGDLALVLSCICSSSSFRGLLKAVAAAH